jgi:hypothetical protein
MINDLISIPCSRLSAYITMTLVVKKWKAGHCTSKTEVDSAASSRDPRMNEMAQ